MGRTDDPTTKPWADRSQDRAATLYGDEHGDEHGDERDSKDAPRSRLARKLNWMMVVVNPVIAGFVVLPGLPVERLSFGRLIFAMLCVAWWPVSLWGALTRTRRVRVHALLTIAPIYTLGVVNIINVGAKTPAVLLLPIVLAGLFFGRRGALVSTVLVVLSFFAMWAAFRAGWFPPPPPPSVDMARPGGWIRMAVSYAAIGLAMVTAMTTSLTLYARALDDLHAEQERRQREAQESIRSRDEFIALAGHELRTPLTPLLLEVHGLERRAARGDHGSADANMAAGLHRIGAQVQRLARLVDELLDVSHVLVGELTVQLEPVDLAAVVRDVADRFAEPLRRSGSSLTLHAPTECVGLWDRSRLDQVVTNLLLNAIKYGAGKPIELSLEVAPDTATLVVRDHGIGIDDVARDRIFGRFERAVPSKHYGGFGLGLWIVKQILEALDGQVRIDSAPGAGTTFFVALPRRAAVRSETAPRTDQPSRLGRTGREAPRLH